MAKIKNHYWDKIVEDLENHPPKNNYEEVIDRKFWIEEQVIAGKRLDKEDFEWYKEYTEKEQDDTNNRGN